MSKLLKLSINLFLCRGFKNFFVPKNTQFPLFVLFLNKVISLSTHHGDYVIAECKVLRVVEPLNENRPFNRNTCRHSQGRIFPFPLSISLSAHDSPPGSCARGRSIVSLQRQGWRRLTSGSAPRAHPSLAPATPRLRAFLSPALCKHCPLFFALYSVCLIQAARWVNAPTPLAGRASPSGRSQWGPDSDWLNMPLCLANYLWTRGAFTPSLFLHLCPCRSFRKEAPGCEEDSVWRAPDVMMQTYHRCERTFGTMEIQRGGLCNYFVAFPAPPPKFWF